LLDDDDRLRRAVIGALMCYSEVELGRLAADHGVDAARYFAREIAEIGALGDLASYDAAAGRVRTTPLGRLLVRNVCMVFDRYHREPATLPGMVGGQPAEAPRFSSTI
jgi:oxygen-independent coproporphyrinogen-3 oxidase